MANTQKTAILRALINDAVVEILVKSKIENVVYSVNEDGTEVTLATKLAEIIADLATKDTIADREAAIAALKTELMGEGVPEALDTFKEVADAIAENEEVADALNAAIGNKADKTTVEAIQTALDTLTETVNGLGALAQKSSVSESDLDAALAEKVNASAEGNHSHANKTVLDGITEQKVTGWDDAASKAHTHENIEELNKIASGDKAKWDQAASDVDTIKGDYLKAEDKYDDTALVGRVAAIEADYLKEEDKYDDTALAGRVKAIEDDYLKGADKTELQGGIDENAEAIAAVKEDVDAFFKDADLTESAKDTLKEIQTYIDSDAEAAAAMTASIKQNADAIDAVEGRMDTAEGKIQALEAIEHHTHDNKTVIDGITAEKVAAWDAAEGNAKQHATDLNTAMDTRVQAVEAAKHTHANQTELDKIAEGDKAKWDEAAGKAHEHGNKAVLDGITAEQVASWNVKGRIIYSATQPADLTENDLWVQLLD